MAGNSVPLFLIYKAAFESCAAVWSTGDLWCRRAVLHAAFHLQVAVLCVSGTVTWCGVLLRRGQQVTTTSKPCSSSPFVCASIGPTLLCVPCINPLLLLPVLLLGFAAAAGICGCCGCLCCAHWKCAPLPVFPDGLRLAEGISSRSIVSDWSTGDHR